MLDNVKLNLNNIHSRFMKFGVFITVLLLFSCTKEKQELCACTKEYFPVCAAGKQYANPCLAQCAGFSETEIIALDQDDENASCS